MDTNGYSRKPNCELDIILDGWYIMMCFDIAWIWYELSVIVIMNPKVLSQKYTLQTN